MAYVFHFHFQLNLWVGTGQNIQPVLLADCVANVDAIGQVCFVDDGLAVESMYTSSWWVLILNLHVVSK